MKLYISNASAPLGTHVATFVPMAKPFWKVAGGNEIDVVESNAARGTRCWMYGSENGQGSVLPTLDYGLAAYFGVKDTADKCNSNVVALYR